MEHAWGADELQPVNKTGTKTYGGLAATIIDSMSTLHVMGLHDEFARCGPRRRCTAFGASHCRNCSALCCTELGRLGNRQGAQGSPSLPPAAVSRPPAHPLTFPVLLPCSARDWVVEHARFDAATHVSFFETVIRLLGGLLSAHQLSGDPALLERARDLGEHLLPVFRVSPTGIPDNSVHLPAANTGTPQGLTCLAELGSDTLEFGTLSALTGDPKYALEAERGIRALHANYPDRVSCCVPCRLGGCIRCACTAPVGAQHGSWACSAGAAELRCGAIDGQGNRQLVRHRATGR